MFLTTLARTRGCVVGNQCAWQRSGHPGCSWRGRQAQRRAKWPPDRIIGGTCRTTEKLDGLELKFVSPAAMDRSRPLATGHAHSAVNVFPL